MYYPNTAIFYLSILAFILVASLCYVRAKDSIVKLLLLFLMFIGMCVPSSIRYGIGTDYFAYLDVFEKASKDFSEVEKYEPIYKFILYIGLKFDLGQQFVFAVLAILTAFFVLKIYVALPNRVKTLFIFLYITVEYLFSYNGVRQSIAVLILGYSFLLHLNGGKTRSFFYFLLSLGFHYSPILALPLYFTHKIKQMMLNRSIGFAIGITIVLIFVQYGLVFFIVKLLPAWFPYAYYFVETNYLNVKVVFGSGIGFMVNLLIAFLPLILSKRFIQENSKYVSFYWVSLIMIFTTLMSAELFIFSRLVDVYSIIYLIVLSITLGYIRSYYLRNGAIFVICLFFFLVFIKFTGSSVLLPNGSYGGPAPYTTIFH